MNSDNPVKWMNTLYFGDNLEVLKKYLPDNPTARRAIQLQ